MSDPFSSADDDFQPLANRHNTFTKQIEDLEDLKIDLRLN